MYDIRLWELNNYQLTEEKIQHQLTRLADTFSSIHCRKMANDEDKLNS